MSKAVATKLSDEATKKLLLQELAEHFNVALVPMDNLSKQIACAIGFRLKAQSGLEIYQSSAFNLDNIPLSVLRAILPAETLANV